MAFFFYGKAKVDVFEALCDAHSVLTPVYWFTFLSRAR